MPEDFNLFGDFLAHSVREESCRAHPALRRSESIEEAELWRRTVENCAPSRRREHLRWLALNDLYFLLAFVLHRSHLLGDKEPFNATEADNLIRARIKDRDGRRAAWCFARCTEYQTHPWNHLDLWCVSDDTEFLTQRGWLAIDKLDRTDKFATRTLDSGEFQWQEAEAINRQPYVGKMVRLYSKNLGEFLVTPNHSVLLDSLPRGLRYRNAGKGDVLVEARDLVGHASLKDNHKIPVTSKWQGTPVPVQRFGGALEMSGATFCAFMGMWLSEGSVRADAGLPPAGRGRRNGATKVNGYSVLSPADRKRRKAEARKRANAKLVNVAQREKSKGFAAFKRLLGSLGPTITYSGGNFQFQQGALAEYLRSFGGALDKFVPDVIMNGTPANIQVFLHYFWLGDGSGKANYFYTSSLRMADQIGELIQKAGDSASLFVDARVRAVTYADGHTIATENPNYCVTLRKSKTLNFNADEVPYAGHVACVTVPNGTLLVRRKGKVMWTGNSREHFKSEIITFGGNIQSILRDPNETVGIFSHTRPIAKGFLRMIKGEFEQNEELKALFDDVLYAEPVQQAPHWGEDVGIFVKRKSNRNTATVEAWGLVDGQPVSKRFTILSYDDVVSRKEITDLMIPRTTEEFQNSLLLTASDPVRFRYAATFQEIGDTTQQLIDRGFTARVRPGVTEDNKSLCLSDEKVGWFKDNLSPKVFALQILLDQKKAKGEHQLGFASDWLEDFVRRTINLHSLNKYILVDPAGESKQTDSHFALGVVGLSPDRRYKWLDGVYDKLNLDERTEALKLMCQTYQPKLVFYEKQAMQSDIEHIRGVMRKDLWEYEIVPVGTNQLSKDQRIEMLIPVFKGRQFHLPEEGIKYRPVHPDGNYGQASQTGEIDIVKVFVEREYGKWPITEFKDLLDMFSWLVHPDVVRRLSWPRPYGDKATESGPWGSTGSGGVGGWMAE